MDLGKFTNLPKPQHIVLITLQQAYSPETGGRPFEENQRFFQDARDQGTWRVGKVDDGEFKYMPGGEKGRDDETAPLLSNGT